MFPKSRNGIYWFAFFLIFLWKTFKPSLVSAQLSRNCQLQTFWSRKNTNNHWKRVVRLSRQKYAFIKRLALNRNVVKMLFLQHRTITRIISVLGKAIFLHKGTFPINHKGTIIMKYCRWLAVVDVGQQSMSTYRLLFASSLDTRRRLQA